MKWNSVHIPMTLLCWAVVFFAVLSASSAVAATTEYELKLAKGENYVSIPGNYGDTTVQAIFGSNLDTIASIEYYDSAAGSWLSYVPGATGNTLDNIPFGRAFVITVKEDTSFKLVINGDNDIFVDMYAGWNSFGVTNKTTLRTIAAGSKIPQYLMDYDVIYSVDDKGGLAVVGVDEELVPGRFYWLDNDPDGDGVSSMDETTTYVGLNSSPLVKDLKIGSDNQAMLLVPQQELLNKDKIAFIKSTCGIIYTPGNDLDGLFQSCRAKMESAENKFADLKASYTVPGPDVKLGDFVITQVLYKTDDSGKKTEGIGLIKNEGLPSDLSPLFAMEGGRAPVFIDLKDGDTVIGAYSRNVEGVRLGTGDNVLRLDPGNNNAKVEYLSIDKAGSLECELSAELDGLPARNYFVMWLPKARHSSPPDLKLSGDPLWLVKDNSTSPEIGGGNMLWLFNSKEQNYIQLGLVLGDDVVASRVWDEKGERGKGETKWLINFPAGAKGLFEPVVKKGSEDVRIAFNDSPFYWLPAALMKDTAGKPISPLQFTAGINGVDVLSGLHKGTIPYDGSYSEITISEEGGIETIGNAKLQYKEGNFVFGDKKEVFQGFMKGWTLTPAPKPYYVMSHRAVGWNPSFAFRIGAEDTGVVKDVGISGSLSVGLIKDVLMKSADKNQPAADSSFLQKIWAKIREVKMSSIEGDYLLKLLLDFEGPQLDLECGGGLKLEVLKREGDEKTYLVTATSNGVFPFALDSPDNTYDLKIKATAIDTWIAQSSSSDRKGFKRRVTLDGFGVARFPDSWPIIGGQDLSVNFLGDITSTGAYSKEKQKYAVKKRITTRLGEDAVKDYSGWQFSLDEVTVEFEEGSVESGSLLDYDFFGSGSGQSTGVSVIPNPLAGLLLVPEAAKNVAKSGWKPARFTGYATVAPPDGWKFGGPFEALVLVERKRDTENNSDYWATTVTADMNLKVSMGGGDMVFKQLMLTRTTQGHEWLVLADAEFHVSGRIIAGTVIFKDGGFTMMAKGSNLGDVLSGADLMLDFVKGADGTWTWTVGVGLLFTKESLAGLFGVDKSTIHDDLLANGVINKDGMIVLQLGSIPLPFLTSKLPPWIELDRVRNVVYSKTGDEKWDIVVDADFLFPTLEDTDGKPRDQWPRFTLSFMVGSSGTQLSGKTNIDINASDYVGKFTIVEVAVAKGNKDWKGDLQVDLQPGKVWADWLEQNFRIKLPDKIRGIMMKSSAGWLAGAKWDPAPVIKLAGSDMQIKMKELIFKKMSPWSSGLASTLTIGGKDVEGIVEIGQKTRFVSTDSTSSVTIDLTGGFKVRIDKLGIDLGPGFALSGDVVITMPEGNVMNGIVGNSFAAKVSGSTEKYSFSTDTNISSVMDMGLLGKASFTITSLSLSSDGSFAGSGTMTIAGQTTSFVIGTRADGLYFMADFGATGIDIKLANLFMLKVKHKIGLESAGPYQYVRIDDMKTSLGSAVAGADVATDKFLYFLPASVPPVGFAFFDNLEGKVSIAGFAVGLGMSFPAPDVKDLGTVMGVLGTAFTGGTVNVTSLNKLGAPSFGLRDVALNFPKVPGYVWKDLKLQRTDNLFAAIFGSDRLDIVKSASLKPKDFVELITANSPMDVIKVAVPADKRKGSMNIDLRGFKTAVSYDLRSDELIYEKREVKKLPGMYTFISKLLYVDKNNGGLPAELKGSGGAAAGATAITGDYTELKVKHSGKSMDIAGMSTDDGANVRQWVSWSGENQKWRLNPAGGDYYQIEAKISGKCLDVAGSGTKNGANVQQWACTGADNQKWKLILKGNDYYQLQAKHSGKCLDVAGVGTQDGANIHQWECGSGDNQKWLIPRGTGGSRSKTVDVVMPKEHGSGTAKVTWKVEDITAELKAIKEIVSAITPAQNTKWEDHLTTVWNQFAQKGLSFNGNRASFRYSPTVTAELELTEYDDSLDITGLKYVNNELSARFGTTTLYSEKNFEGKSWTIADDVSEDSMQSSAIGTRNLSSVKIEGRGKVVLNGSIKIFSTRIPLVSELTGSLEALDDSKVSDNQATSAKVFYPISTGKVTGWRLVFKSDKGIVTTVDAGGIEVVFPEGSRALSLLPNGRLFKAVGDTRKVLEDLKPYPLINSHPTDFITSIWNNRVLPRKDYYIDTTVDDDVEENEKPVEFRRGDGGIIGFIPLKYDGDRKVAGLKFDQKQGTLNGKFGKITLYEHANYEGKYLVVDEDIPDLGETTFGNDAASSIKLEEGAVATLYSDRQYKERWYYDYTTLKAQHSGKCLDVSGYSRQSGANIHQWDCHGADNQLWKLVPKEGWYSLVPKHSGKCADVYGGSQANGANVIQWDCHGGHNQEWKLTSLGGNAYSLRNHHSGKCLDVSGAGTHAGANVQQWACVDVGQQTWLMNLNKAGFLTTAFEKESGWLGGHGIGNDSVRSVKVYNPLDIGKVKEWKLLQSTPTGGNVILAYVKDSGGHYKSVINTDLRGTGHNIQSYYDDNGTLLVTAYAASGAKFPADNYRVYVKGTPYELTDITEASQYVRIITKSVKLPDGATAVLNEDGGISAQHADVAISPAEEAPSTSVFTLPGPDGMSLRFNITKAAGFGAAQIEGSKPLAYAPVYADDSGVPQGIKKVVGKVEGGFFMDAGLNVGTAATAQVNLHVSGAIKTDGNYYLKGNGNLIIANLEVSEAVIELSSEKGLIIKGKMDLYGAKVDITGYLTPDNKFSFTGTAQVMISGSGIKGALGIDYAGKDVSTAINGSVYLANKKIASGTFAIKDGTVSWPTKVSIGYAGFDSTVAIALKQGAASYAGKAYINVDIPIYVWGPKGWKCKRYWGVKVCWPRSWGNIRVGTLGIHHSTTVKGSISGSSVGIKLGIATLSVDVSKPSVKASW